MIRAREILLIDHTGEKRGVVARDDALQMAEDVGLDLVEVSPNTTPPVCKILDYGKLQYQARKKKTASKQHTQMKEVQFSMKISEHDIETKLKRARDFIDKGHKLRFNLILRGRERSYADTKGRERLKSICERLADVAIVEQTSKGMVGNRLSAILAPAKK